MSACQPHRTRAWLCTLIGVALLMLSACQAAPSADGEKGSDPNDVDMPVAPSHDPIIFPHAGNKKVNPMGGEERQLSEEEAGWQEKWELASRYAKAGYDAEALMVIDAALKLEPGEPWGTRLRGLRTTLRMRKTEQELLRAEVRPTRDYVLFGRRVDLVIRLRNVSSEVITLLPPATASTGQAQVSPTAVVLELARRDRDISGSELGRQWTQTLFLQRTDGKPIRIPPGGRYEQAARIPPSEVGGHLSGFRSLEVGGTLRTTRLLVGDTERPVRVPLRRARVAVLPPGYEPLAEAPIASIRKSIENVAPIHLLVATEFVPSSQRIEAVGLLAGALGEGHESLHRPAFAALRLIRDRSVGRPIVPLASPLMDALARWPARAAPIMRGLAAVTGVDVAPDVRLWRDWWRRTRAARTSVAVGER